MSILGRLIAHRRSHKRRRHIRDYFRIAPSGVITGAADNDPSGIVTYTQVGALTRFSQLWLMLLTIPMLIEVEEMSARIGVVTKHGLNSNLKKHFGLPLALLSALIILICNVATIGADIAGMAAVSELLTGISWFYFILPIAFILGYLLVKENFKKISRFLFLLTPVFLLYVITAFIVSPPWREVLTSTFIPHLKFNFSYIMAAVALLGTTISPYLIFWQTTEEVEEKKTISNLKEESKGVAAGMIFCNLIFYFIILTAGAVLFGQVAGGIGTAAEAASVLKPLAGNLAFLLFSLGILASGIIAVPVLAASAAYVLTDTLGWKGSLDKGLSQAKAFYLVIILSLALGSGLILLGLSPIQMLFYSQILNGILVPILLVLVLKICNDQKIMGLHTNTKWDNFVGLGTVILMATFALAMFWQILPK